MCDKRAMRKVISSIICHATLCSQVGKPSRQPPPRKYEQILPGIVDDGHVYQTALKMYFTVHSNGGQKAGFLFESSWKVSNRNWKVDMGIAYEMVHERETFPEIQVPPNN